MYYLLGYQLVEKNKNLLATAVAAEKDLTEKENGVTMPTLAPRGRPSLPCITNASDIFSSMNDTLYEKVCLFAKLLFTSVFLPDDLCVSLLVYLIMQLCALLMRKNVYMFVCLGICFVVFVFVCVLFFFHLSIYLFINSIIYSLFIHLCIYSFT